MTVYEKIDRAIKQHEKHGYYERSLSSIADYISWAWKWRKITEAEKDDACDRVCALLEGEINGNIY